jgi:hypothetical protein
VINQNILKYIDNVMSLINVDEEDKVKMENDLIRRIIRSEECDDIQAIVEKLGTPKEQAMKIVARYDSDAYEYSRYGGTSPKRRHERYMPQKPYGEYMYEENNTDIKLLYIPLIQISSGTERIRIPIVDSCHEY